MIAVFDSIVDAHAADNFPVQIAYGPDSMKKEAIEALVKQRGTVRYLQPAPLNLENSLRLSTNGDVKTVEAFALVFSATAHGCVEALQDWFIRVGFVSQTGIVGHPGTGPWAYSTLSLLAYNPIGGLEQFAQQYGQVYVIEQFVRISIA